MDFVYLSFSEKIELSSILRVLKSKLPSHFYFIIETPDNTYEFSSKKSNEPLKILKENNKYIKIVCKYPRGDSNTTISYYIQKDEFKKLIQNNIPAKNPQISIKKDQLILDLFSNHNKSPLFKFKEKETIEKAKIANLKITLKYHYFVPDLVSFAERIGSIFLIIYIFIIFFFKKYENYQKTYEERLIKRLNYFYHTFDFFPDNPKTNQPFLEGFKKLVKIKKRKILLPLAIDFSLNFVYEKFGAFLIHKSGKIYRKNLLCKKVLKNNNFFSFFPPRLANSIRKNFEKEKNVYNVPLKIDGKYYKVNLIKIFGYPLYLGLMQDFTEERELEILSHAKRAFWLKVLYNLKSGIVILDKNLNIIFCNHYVANLFMRKVSKILGKNVNELTDSIKDFEPYIISTLKTGKIIDGKSIKIHTHIGEINLKIRIYPLDLRHEYVVLQIEEKTKEQKKIEEIFVGQVIHYLYKYSNLIVEKLADSMAIGIQNVSLLEDKINPKHHFVKSKFNPEEIEIITSFINYLKIHEHIDHTKVALKTIEDYFLIFRDFLYNLIQKQNYTITDIETSLKSYMEENNIPEYSIELDKQLCSSLSVKYLLLSLPVFLNYIYQSKTIHNVQIRSNSLHTEIYISLEISGNFEKDLFMKTFITSIRRKEITNLDDPAIILFFYFISNILNSSVSIKESPTNITFNFTV